MAGLRQYWSRVIVNRGDSFQNLSTPDFQEALENYELAIQLFPQNPESYYGQGAVLAQQRKWSRAIEAFEKAYQADPSYQKARFAVVRVLWESGEGEKAEELFNQEINRKPRDPIEVGLAWHERGLFYSRSRNLAEAEISFLRALNFISHDEETYFQLVQTYLNQGKETDAIKKLVACWALLFPDIDVKNN